MKATVTLHAGDNRLSLAEMPENSVDAVVTDPPYGLVAQHKRFSKADSKAPIDAGTDGSFGRISKGMMGKRWDGSGIEYSQELWSNLLRVLKPGGVCLAFSASRTYHRAATAAEDAGFLIYPMTGWVYGQGMSLSPELAKMIDKHLGVSGSVVPSGEPVRRLLTGAEQHARGTWIKDNGREYQPGEYLPASPEAIEWSGWRPGAHARRTALEPIIFAVKPMTEKSAAANVLRWGTGAFNIGDTRTPEGRHPANLLHDGSQDVVALFPDAPGQLAKEAVGTDRRKVQHVYGELNRGSRGREPRNDSGSGARFFNSFPFDEADIPTIVYHKKATAADRAGSKHPTVKPIGLMRHLIRHICPPGGTVLDPFAGSGTTAAAAQAEGMNCILMEMEDEYLAFLRQRFDLADPESISVDGDDLAELLGCSVYDEDLADLI